MALNAFFQTHLDPSLRSLMVFFPTIGALLILVIKGLEPLLRAKKITIPGTFWRWIGIGVTGVPLLLSVRLWHQDEPPTTRVASN